MTKAQEVQTETVVVLNQKQYEKLEGQLPKPLVNQSVTDIQAGYLLGVQAVLSILRNGFVTGR